MIQNVPPDESREDGYGTDENAGRLSHSDEAEYREGPYGSRVRDSNADLDAGSPVLRSSDVQRLNRKALIFLAGIVALLIVAIVFGFSKLRGEKEEAKVREEAPRIPDAPTPVRAPALPPDAEPIALQETSTELPALPRESDLGSQQERGVQGPLQQVGPSLVERRMMDVSGGAAGTSQANDPFTQAMLAGVGPQAEAQPQVAGASTVKATSAQYIRNPDVLMVRGTYIRCVLETRIVTDIPGFTSCIVTEPVYSINGRSLLLPRGSKVLGSYDYEPKGPRVAVVWDRITTPNGIDVSMKSPGVDNLGGAGHDAKYTAHWGSRIASALLISLISDAFKYAAAENGPQSSTVSASGLVVQEPYESATARSMERLANQSLDNRRPPTAIINQGTVVNVYVAQDVDFAGVVSKF